MKEKCLSNILSRLSDVHVLVVGDLFLDKYLILKKELSEASLETGLEAYQAVQLRLLPGAAGTVAKDLCALGTMVSILAVIGDDGEGYELKQALLMLGVNIDGLIVTQTRHTPTYMKPMMWEQTGEKHELNRIDIRNREVMPPEVEELIIEALRQIIPRVDGVAICDQVEERNCGVITDWVRDELSQLAAEYPEKVFIVDSRARIDLFRNVIYKPNDYETALAMGVDPEERANRTALRRWGKELYRVSGKPVFITAAEQGIFVFPNGDDVLHVPAIPVEEPIDVVGAGDAVMAGLLVALCQGASPEEAAVMACLIASITIKQVGTTGTARPKQILAQFHEWQGTDER